MLKICQVLLVLSLFSLGIETSAKAQKSSNWAVEMTAGVAQDLLVRGPWVAPNWRRHLIGRVAICFSTSVLYERLLDEHGWSWQDVEQRAVGTLTTELVFYLVKKHA